MYDVMAILITITGIDEIDSSIFALSMLIFGAHFFDDDDGRVSYDSLTHSRV